MSEQYGCCKSIDKMMPRSIDNRPGLKALDYRIGIHATFHATMLARLSDLAWKATDQDGQVSMIHPLRDLTTRELDDFSIALLDAWAVVGDVLTFYQERIANEGYLRTATELRSLLELASLIGYRLKPGVSSSVDLAFTLEKGYEVEIPAGTKVQSLPAPGEAAQTFETSYKVKARAEWNEIKARISQPQSITWEKASEPDEFSIYFKGTALNLKPNQGLLFVFDGENKQILRLIKSAELQPLQDRTKVTLQKRIPYPPMCESAAMRPPSAIADYPVSAKAKNKATMMRSGTSALKLSEKATTSPIKGMVEIYINPKTREEYRGAVLGNVQATVNDVLNKSSNEQKVKASLVPRDPGRWAFMSCARRHRSSVTTPRINWQAILIGCPLSSRRQ